MASKIQEIVIRLATYMEQRAMRGMLKIIFRNGQGILEFILRQCDINLKFDYYWLPYLTETQVVVYSILAGGTPLKFKFLIYQGELKH